MGKSHIPLHANKAHSMTKLDRSDSSQKFKATELDEVLLLRREYVPACQQSMNAFAGANEVRGLLPNRKHAGFS
jgi:hypothetical protein